MSEVIERIVIGIMGSNGRQSEDKKITVKKQNVSIQSTSYSLNNSRNHMLAPTRLKTEQNREYRKEKKEE